MDILALDLGTSSVRGLVLDADAAPRPGALARRKVSVAFGDDGAATLDGPGYLARLTQCLDELAAGGHLRDVGLVATSGQWHSLLPLDRAGAPTRRCVGGRPPGRPGGRTPPPDGGGCPAR